MKKPKWWTGSWAFKSVLIWLGGFLVWLPIFSRWPDSVQGRVATLIFLLSMLPMIFFYALGVLGRLLGFVSLVYTLVAMPFSGARASKNTRNARLS